MKKIIIGIFVFVVILIIIYYTIQQQKLSKNPRAYLDGGVYKICHENKFFD